MISAQDVTVVVVIAIVLFGVKKLPELGQGIGEAIRNFKKGLSEPGEIDVTPKKEEPSKQEIEKNAAAKS
jgi:sec-independent protein translocase protein TatA